MNTKGHPLGWPFAYISSPSASKSGRCPNCPLPCLSFHPKTSAPSDTETLLAALKDASETYLKGILGYNTLPLVSMDFKGDPHSSILEAPYTTVQNGNLVKVVAWYDNEWGYSNMVVRLLEHMVAVDEGRVTPEKRVVPKDKPKEEPAAKEA